MFEKETLSSVLTDTGCAELPPVLSGNTIYVRAIAKVLKANNHEAMAIIVNDGYGRAIIKKSYGSCSMIKSIVEIYPLSVLNGAFIPDFRKKQDVRNFLIKAGESAEKISELLDVNDEESRAKIKQMVISHCVKAQLLTEDLFGNEKKDKNEVIAEQNNNEQKEEENGTNGEIIEEED